MKRLLAMALTTLLLTSLMACGSTGGSEPAADKSSAETVSEDTAAADTADAVSTEDASADTVSAQSAASGSSLMENLEEHTIAVLIYDRTDDEVISFRRYLQDYIGSVFNVNFLYSDSIASEEEALAFIQEAADYGAEGVMSFNSYDLEAETALCEQNGIYFMMASGTVSNEEFAKAEKNPYFLGVVGPGRFIEYKAGSDMLGYFVEQEEGNEYFILSGGGCMGNEMHYLRTVGILDTLQNAYDVTFDKTTEEIARSEEPYHFESDAVKVVVAPGYLTFPEVLETCEKEYAEHPYGNVLSVLPAAKMLNSIKGAKLGMVDCYSEANLQLFANGQLHYLTGKYSSIIGPSFAAMYNAVTGHADVMREKGRPFYATQGFWSSTSLEDYTEKYAYASSLEKNAYNYEDLSAVMLAFNKDATVADLKELAKAYSFEKAVERRSTE